MPVKNKHYKYRIRPNAEQRQFFANSFGANRFLWNQMLGESKKFYEETGQHRILAPTYFKKDYSFLSEVDSLGLSTTWKNLTKAYRNFFKGGGKVGLPGFKSKHRSRKSYTTWNLKGTVRLEGSKLKLPKVGFVKIILHRPIPKGCAIKSATISQDRVGDYYVSLLLAYEVPEPNPVEVDKAIGLDYSMPDLYVDHTGAKPGNPKFFRNSQAKLAKDQRKLSRMQKDSNNYNKQKIKVAKAHRKIARQRKDFLNKKSTQIANEYDLVAVEDIELQGMAQAMRFGKSVNDNGFGVFREMLKYKLADRNKAYVVIDKWFPSTKTCYECGGYQKLELGQRIYECHACERVFDRDQNAALNIRREGVKNRGTHGVSLRLLGELILLEQEAPAS